ncbi:MAG: sugar ABC transporter permease [Lachnospiraceae bacterium]|nr:sugar ABC transporter permease [Lachnospiraceae bacterium]
MRKKGSSLSKFGYLLPAIVLMALFFVWPIILTIYFSFTNLALTGSAAANFRFIGVENYAKMFSDSSVKVSLVTTIFFVVFSVVGQTILGFTIAYLMKAKNKIFRRIVGAIVLAGWVMPETVAAICAYTFMTDKGTLNEILGLFGIGMVSWLFKYPLLSVILANIWHGTAFSMMVYQSALDNVPEDVMESAKMDGAGKLQTLFGVTIPIIKDTVLTNTMLITLSTLGTFGMVYTMTGTTVQTLPIFMYMRAFKNYELGYGTAISMLVLLIGAVFSIFYVKIQGKDMDK